MFMFSLENTIREDHEGNEGFPINSLSRFDSQARSFFALNRILHDQIDFATFSLMWRLLLTRACKFATLSSIWRLPLIGGLQIRDF